MSNSRHRGGTGFVFRVVVKAASARAKKRVSDCGVRALKSAIKTAIPDLEKTINESERFTSSLVDWLCTLLESAAPRQLDKGCVRVLLQHQASMLTRLDNLRVPAPIPAPAAIPAPIPALAAIPAAVPPPVPRTPPPARVAQAPNLQPRSVDQRVGPRGDPRFMWPVPHNPDPFAHNPHAAFTVPVVVSDDMSFLFKRILMVVEYPNGERFVQLEWEPSLVPLGYVPPGALAHVNARRATIRGEPTVVVGGTARYAVDGVLEIVSTPRAEFALVQWAPTLEPIANVEAEDVEAFMSAFQRNGYRRLHWQQ